MSKKTKYQVVIATIYDYTKDELNNLSQSPCPLVICKDFEQKDICGKVTSLQIYENTLLADIELLDKYIGYYVAVGHSYPEFELIYAGLTLAPADKYTTKLA